MKRRISGNVEWPRLAEIANVIGLSEWYLLSIYYIRLSTSISYQDYFDAKLVMPKSKAPNLSYHDMQLWFNITRLIIRYFYTFLGKVAHLHGYHFILMANSNATYLHLKNGRNSYIN